MKRFLVDDSSFAQRISSLTGLDDADSIARAFAGATLSLITEPGDRFAGALSQALSPELFVELEVKRTPTEFVASKLAEHSQLEEIESIFGDFHNAHREARQRWSPRMNLVELSNSLDCAIRVGAQLLTRESSDWPIQLQDLQLATPHCLWLRGKSPLAVLREPSLSLVGSRVSTSYGEWVTSEIVADAASRGLAIVSGGAYGIDAIAHRSAIAAGQPTFAFMAGGIDRLYPSGNAALLERIIETGFVIAEQAPGASPTKWRFLQRNRLIAALGLATIVVEAGFRSGALNTVTHAKELDRPIGAVPGAITSQSSAGCNRLIGEGFVTSILSASDAADLALGSQGWFQPELGGIGAFETRALDAMSNRGQTEAQIAARAGLTAKEISIALGQLVLLGFVKQGDRGWVKLPLKRE